MIQKPWVFVSRFLRWQKNIDKHLSELFVPPQSKWSTERNESRVQSRLIALPYFVFLYYFYEWRNRNLICNEQNENLRQPTNKETELDLFIVMNECIVIDLVKMSGRHKCDSLVIIHTTLLFFIIHGKDFDFFFQGCCTIIQISVLKLKWASITLFNI